ncbi:HK97 gp10 family phage protein [Niallia sp. RD1]|uniref:HK97 gp10 family phage protein n=1 Tax=Niallia sp. RD1 TaxID=2962858 RepID=UPI0020C1B8C8|nr:HK97 gp10 family phage protein [Niallia sp. RD1]UTI44433.1 HK97 gp10 family phage protein [Niallia sp. RD1]
MARRRNVEIEGLDNLMRTLRTIENIPQRVATKAAKKGMNIAYKAARRNAPVDEGNIKKGIILKPERTRKKGKKVYFVTLDRSMNHIFQGTSNQTVTRWNRRTKRRETRNKTSYYPASQEYGFMARDGRYIPGYQYLRKSIDGYKREIEKEIVRVATDEIDKLPRN